MQTQRRQENCNNLLVATVLHWPIPFHICLHTTPSCSSDNNRLSHKCQAIYRRLLSSSLCFLCFVCIHVSKLVQSFLVLTEKSWPSCLTAEQNLHSREGEAWKHSSLGVLPRALLPLHPLPPFLVHSVLLFFPCGNQWASSRNIFSETHAFLYTSPIE